MSALPGTPSNDSTWGGKWFLPAAAALVLALVSLLGAIIERAADPDGGFGEILSELTSGFMAIGWGLGVLTLAILAFAIIRRQDEDRDRFTHLATSGQWMTIVAFITLVVAQALR